MTRDFAWRWFKHSAQAAAWMTVIAFGALLVVSVAAVLWLDGETVLAVSIILLLVFCGVGLLMSKEEDRLVNARDRAQVQVENTEHRK